MVSRESLGLAGPWTAHTTKSILIGLEVRKPNTLTARPKPQYPVLLHVFPVCDPPLYSMSNVLRISRRTLT